MKKWKWLVPALCVTLSMGIFAACGEKEPCKTHVDADNNGKCDECGADISTPATEYKITDGVYIAQADASHRILLKFYEDGTFYIEGMQGNAAKGKYEVKDENIQYRPSKEDLTPDVDAEFVTATKAVFFYEMDGTTAMAVNRNKETSAGKELYATATPDNAIAYVNDTLYNVTFDNQTRTLQHSPLNPFTADSEKAIEQYKFMLKNESDIPAGAEDKIVQDYTLILTQKGYETNILGTDAVGKYTLTNNVYTLTGTIPAGAYGTLTVSADGKSATYVNGDKTIELVTWTAAAEKSVATMTGSVVKNIQGNDTTVTFTLSFYGDFTGKIVAQAFGSEMEATAFKWAMAADGRSVLVSEVTKGTLTSIAPTSDYTSVEATWSGDVNANLTGVEVKLSAPATALSALKEVKDPNAVTVLKELKVTKNLGIEVEFTLTLTSDCKAALTASMMGTNINITADWTLSGHTVTFANASKGEFTYAIDANGAHFTWTGDLSDRATNQTIEFTMPSSELADLQGAKPVITEKKVLTTTKNLGINVEFALTFTSDNKVAMTASMMGTEISITADWTLSGHTVTFANASKGEFTYAIDASGAHFTWTGDLSDRATNQTIEFTMPSSELADLQ